MGSGSDELVLAQQVNDAPPALTLLNVVIVRAQASDRRRPVPIRSDKKLRDHAFPVACRHLVDIGCAAIDPVTTNFRI
jgi:hypothetical protein